MLDLGPDDDDEINYLAEGEDYGWPQGAGLLGTPGLTDPIHTWSPAVTPVGLSASRGTDVAAGARRGPLVAYARARGCRVAPRPPQTAI